MLSPNKITLQFITMALNTIHSFIRLTNSSFNHLISMHVHTSLLTQNTST